MNIELDALTVRIIAAAREAAGFLTEQRRTFTTDRIVEKGKYDYVSYIDRETELLLIDRLKPLVPGAGFITEEGQAGYADESWYWVIDPLDGTTNYIHDMAPYCVSIALCRDGEVQIGVVYEVCRNECFHARRGGGAFLNDRPIRVSDADRLEGAFIGIGLPYNCDGYRPLADAMIPRLYGAAAGLRLAGAAAADLCYVAAGRFDCWFEAHLKVWDFAAGSLIVTEAGGSVSGFDGAADIFASHHIAAAATPALHGRLLDMLAPYNGRVL